MKVKSNKEEKSEEKGKRTIYMCVCVCSTSRAQCTAKTE